MSKVELKIIDDFTYPLYYENEKEAEFVSDINYNTFLQLRVDIKNHYERTGQKKSGYYILVDDEKIHIFTNGKLACFNENGLLKNLPKNNFDFSMICKGRLL